MDVQRRFVRILGSAALALAFTVVPTSWAASSPQRAKSGSTMSAMQPKAGAVDINTATVAQLQALPGIGTVYAKRIVDGRPYSSKHDLVSKGILPQSVYEKVKNRIVARRGKR